jgi:hypothetical protein
MIVGAAALSYALLGDLGAKLKRQNAQEVSRALAEAKENVLIFAAMQSTIYNDSTFSPGYMPTPDFDNDGRMGDNADLPYIWYNTNNNNVIGRLPKQHINTNPFYFLNKKQCGNVGTTCLDDGDYSIWVAFSGRAGDGDLRIQNRAPLDAAKLKTNLDANGDGLLSALDCSTQGVVCLDGMPVVGVLIVAGSPLLSQNNRNGAPNDFRQYLDMDNADSNLYNFISRFPSGQTCAQGDVSKCFNDRVIAITVEEWERAISQ